MVFSWRHHELLEVSGGLSVTSFPFLFCRRWRGYVPSGGVLLVHLSEGQAWTQHGPDRWEPSSSSVIRRVIHMIITVYTLFLWCFSFFLFCTTSKWFGSDSWEKRDLRRDPQRWTLDSHPNRAQWVRLTFLITLLASIFSCVHFNKTTCILSLRSDHRGGSRTPQKVRLSGGLFSLIYTKCFTPSVTIPRWRRHVSISFFSSGSAADVVFSASAFCTAEQEGSVCLHDTPQAPEEDDEWVRRRRGSLVNLTVVKTQEVRLLLSDCFLLSSQHSVRHR